MSEDEGRLVFRQWLVDDAWRRVAEAQREFRLSGKGGPLPLKLSAEGIVLGTSLMNGSLVVSPVRKLRHMLVAGTTGSGKTVFLHSLIYQLLRHDDVERVYLVDLKGGLEFARYDHESGKAQTIWEYEAVEAKVAELVALMYEREKIMRAAGQRDWPGARIFMIFDEYAELGAMRPDKRRHDKLLENIDSIARRARSAGVVLVTALQFPASEVLGPTLRANLIMRACFLLPSATLAANVLPDYQELALNPRTLLPGQFIFVNLHSGRVRYLQAHVAPGIDLSND